MRLLKYLPLLGSFPDKTSDVQTYHLHPTQKAYVTHLQNKQEAQKRILEKRTSDDYRPFVVVNHLQDEVVYPAFSSKQKSGGFRLDPGQEYKVQLPSGDLNMFRMWVRRGCTEGPQKGELHCLTGDCGGQLDCQSWGMYGSSLAEIAIFPNQAPPSMFPDLSYVEGGTTLPLKFTVDGCLELSCDTSHLTCPDSMQVLDQNGKLLQCACGAKDWNNLLDPILGCPNEGGAEIQKAWKSACPDVYSFAQDDATGQKYCPFSKAGMRLDIGKDGPNPSTNPSTIPNTIPSTNPSTISSIIPSTTDSCPTTPLVWGPGVEGWDAFTSTYKWEP